MIRRMHLLAGVSKCRDEFSRLNERIEKGLNSPGVADSKPPGLESLRDDWARAQMTFKVSLMLRSHFRE